MDEEEEGSKSGQPLTTKLSELRKTTLTHSVQTETEKGLHKCTQMSGDGGATIGLLQCCAGSIAIICLLAKLEALLLLLLLLLRLATDVIRCTSKCHHYQLLLSLLPLHKVKV